MSRDDHRTSAFSDFPTDELIRISDFESMRISVGVQNTTTRTEVPADEKTELLEVRNRGVVLALPARSCSQGHNLMVRFSGTSSSKEKFEFVSTAKVEKAQALEDGQDRVTLVFLQYDEAGWQKFCARFSDRQNEIEAFLKAARGL
ncbi:MAG: hypothetical protein NDJ89_10580 [Oligoflexia bacterium]|nr:hypothetical protein [Oligoflexia bacterium]